MQVRIIKGVCCNPWYLSALVGDVLDLEEKQANELIELQRAVAIEATPVVINEATTEAPKPKPTKKKAWKT